MIFAAAFAVALALAAPEIPRPESFVVDRANLLSAADRAALTATIEAWKRTTGHELAVLTMPDLGGQSIEDFGHAVAKSWGIGSKDKSDGVLLVVAVKERQVRIEVLGGLEGDLPDAMCGRIIDMEIVPRFRAGDSAGGIRAGVDAIIAAAGGNPIPAMVEYRASRQRKHGLPMVLFPLLLFVIIAITRSGRGGGRGISRFGRRRGVGGVNPWILGGMLGGMGGGSPGGFGGFGGSGTSGGSGGFGGFGGGGHSYGGGATGRW